MFDVQGLTVRFDTHHGTVRAVEDLSYTLDEGETLGLVGESGSGKSVSSLAVMGLVPSPPGTIEAGSAKFAGRELIGMQPKELRRLRGKDLAMIFQDPMTSLNPLLTVGRQLTEVVEVHEGATHRAARLQARDALGEVGIPEPEKRLDAYPHELSGGMRQRVMIAMALMCRPKILFADEPTTALDVTIQAQILELLKRLQHENGMAIVLITHDLGVIAGTADRVHVMYAGRLVEAAPKRPLFHAPAHPYTRGLLASVPTVGGSDRKAGERLVPIEGSPPDVMNLPPGCAFAPRCTAAQERCTHERPLPLHLSDERFAACFEAERILREGLPR